MFRPQIKPPVLFSKNINNSKIIPIKSSQKNDEKKEIIIPKFFQKGVFKR